ncbi:microprocessor complex subunit DGCR8 [Lutzomyia longipalpis]|uniref:microprocessor complex subunit DGCR8 n=1 Tax=Lutzomyia longipalpis TaxID=7200 RepID=UPI0024842288|nr:microprocessor complex subunit DGCR8 [Lutzomyia longipalpis]XP_055679250.1 microprocessor complex subunit DGCR8 [Lutzomyia longipalpis]XP_055679251.1 microprocessor complex subunit DGCR8 [Lutzomyia longipalpis]XP_055679252.1 microprocessor complex subunit DGCR8 [Lutzomyia longipalpis]
METECPAKKMKLNHELENESELRQFQILDELGEEASDSDDEGSKSENEEDESQSDLEEEDIENLLDAGLPEELRQKKKQCQYEERSKIVLEEKGRNHFEVLPEGWVQVTHNSGIPLYLHKASRVCCSSRPYFLGPGSVRKHEIPLSSIPCLNYSKALQKEAEANTKVKAEPPQESNEASNGHELRPLSNAKIETVKENLKAQSLTASQVTEYCMKLFHFKTIKVRRFKSWSARRKFTKNKKQIKNLQRPTLPDGTKLITFPVLNTEGENSGAVRTKKEWIMNPNGKSYVCILHEYVQHALKKQPSYEFKELENAATPYSATVSINELKYGTGYGTSKKQAKSEAARETLEILIPQMKDKITGEKVASTQASRNSYHDLSVFDEIKIEDPRVAEFCAKTTEPSPHAILLTCLQRNFGLGDVHIQYEINNVNHKKNEFKMVVGKHTASVVCKNKRDGKQRASQAILQILHPHIKTWGSLLRLYGNRSIKSFKEKKQEEQEITLLQSKAAINQPNYAILDKLKLEMTKLLERNAAVKPIGTFVPPTDINLPTATGSNLKNVDL